MRASEADRVADAIVDVINVKNKQGCSAMEILAGQLLALCAVARTVPREIAPQPFVDVMNAVHRCLVSMAEQAEEEST